MGIIQIELSKRVAYDWVFNILSGGFLFYQENLHKATKKERFNYFKKNKLLATNMGLGIRFGGDDLRAIAQEIRNGRVYIETDIICNARTGAFKTGIIKIICNIKDKKKYKEYMSSQTKTLSTNAIKFCKIKTIKV